jgi:hypothetical protein
VSQVLVVAAFQLLHKEGPGRLGVVSRLHTAARASG